MAQTGQVQRVPPRREKPALHTVGKSEDGVRPGILGDS
jgi:hypothetical protein